MALNGIWFMKGQSIDKSFSFNGNNFNFWNCRMRVFIKAHNWKLWNINWKWPIHEVEREGKYTKNELKAFKLDEQVMDILHCGLFENNFNSYILMLVLKK